jgi:hypothetical protein
MLVGAGPLTLAPGDSVSMTVAIIIAPPVTGTFTAGQSISPEYPTAANRRIEQVAGNLLNKARALTVPQ